MVRSRWLIPTAALLLLLAACGDPRGTATDPTAAHPTAIDDDGITLLGTVDDDGSLGALDDGPHAVAVHAEGIEQLAAAISPLDEQLAAAIRGIDPDEAMAVAFHHDSCASPETAATIEDGRPTFTVDTQGTLCEAPIPTVAVAAVSRTAVADPAEVATVVDGDRQVIATIANGRVTSGGGLGPDVLGTGAASADATEPDLTEPSATGPLEGELLARISVDPDAAQGFPRMATEPAGQQAMVDAITVEGGDATAVAEADLGTTLLVAFDLGECTTGGAVLDRRDGELVLEGRESDGVCEAIDHEVQIWAVTWAGVPAGTTVDGVVLPTTTTGQRDGITLLGVVDDDGSLAAVADGSQAVAVDADGMERFAAAISPLDGQLAEAVRRTDPSQAFVVAFRHDSCAGPVTSTTIEDGHPTFTVDTQGIDCEAPIPAVAVAAVSWTAVGDPAEVAIVVDGDRAVLATVADGRIS